MMTGSLPSGCRSPVADPSGVLVRIRLGMGAPRGREFEYAGLREVDCTAGPEPVQ